MKVERRKALSLALAVFTVSLLLTLQFSMALAAQPISIKPLGMLPTANTSSARDVSEKGEIAGSSNATGWLNKAVMWTNKGAMVELGTLPGTNMSIAAGINNKGDIVGYCGFSVPMPTGGLTILPYRAVLWTAKGTMVNLGTLPNTNGSLAFAINNNGDVVGYSVMYRVLPDGNITTMPYHAFLWTAKNGMKDLGTLPGGNMSFAFDINNNGQIVGYSNGTNIAPYHAVMWSMKGAITDLGTLPGGNNSLARSINENGQVVGMSNCPTSVQQAFLWTAKDGMKPLAYLPGGNISFAYAINNNGQIVGSSNALSTTSHGFLWTAKGGMIDLGTLPGQSNSIALGINDNGQIVGSSFANPPLPVVPPQAVLWDTRGRNP